MDSFNFSAEPIKIPVKINSEDYVLTEASEDAFTAYRNVSQKAMKLIDGHLVSDGGQEADTVLVQRCLFKIIEGKPSLPVELAFIRGLPRRITKPLYNKIREISGFDEDEETAAFLTKRIEQDTKKLAILKNNEATDSKNV